MRVHNTTDKVDALLRSAMGVPVLEVNSSDETKGIGCGLALTEPKTVKAPKARQVVARVVHLNQ